MTVSNKALCTIVDSPKLSFGAKSLYLLIATSGNRTYDKGFRHIERHFHESKYRLSREINQLENLNLVKGTKRSAVIGHRLCNTHVVSTYQAKPVSESKL